MLKKFAPFLKLYTDYIKNFDNASSLITLWTAKSSKFMALLEELQVCCDCTFISLSFVYLKKRLLRMVESCNNG